MARNPLNPRGPYKKRPVMPRLLARSVRNPITGCLEWTGGRASKMGYGVSEIDGRQQYLHRWSYAHHHRPIPKGMLVCHSCDNPVCWEPSHLFLGSHKQNSADAV